MAIVTTIVAILAAVLTLIAFAIDIALFGLVKMEFDGLGAGITTKTGPGSSTSDSHFLYHLETQSFFIHSFPSCSFKQVFGWLLPPWFFFSSVLALHVSYVVRAKSALTQQFPLTIPLAIPLKYQKKSRSGSVENVINRAKSCYTLSRPYGCRLMNTFFSTFMPHLRFVHLGMECKAIILSPL